MVRNPGSASDPGAPQPGHDQFSGTQGTGGGDAGPPWPGEPGGPGGPRKQRMHPLTIAAIVVIAAAVGAIGVLVFAKGSPSSTPSAGATPSSSASALPSQGTGGGGSSGGVGIPGAPAEIFMAGRVTAVSGTSITIAGPSHVIKAAITSATKFEGKAKSISQVKVGDIITAQVDNTKNPAVVTVLQDPAQIP
jgi:hypothetical protein